MARKLDVNKSLLANKVCRLGHMVRVPKNANVPMLEAQLP